MARLPFVASLRFGDPHKDFAPYADCNRSFFLDSSLFNPKQGRFSFWGYHPLAVFESQEGFVTFNGHTTINSPLLALKELYQKIRSLPFDPYLPFCGGLVGFLGYEWGAALENIAPVSNLYDPPLPDSWFGLYDTIVGYDHMEKACWVSSWGLDEHLHCDEALARERCEKLAAHIEENRRIKEPEPETARLSEHFPEFLSSLHPDEYFRTVEKILDYLRAGDCYQVNLSQRFMAASYLPPWQQYLRLREMSAAPYSCFLQGGTFQILSSSPECFLQAKADGTLITRPIKGTRRRGATPEEDRKLREELEQSSKDQAELLMITDLERNDLGKICLPGSVEVPELRTIESFAQVHHLLSTVCGKKRGDLDIIDCIAACSPGGSITGAPKIRAMEIIRELERAKRGVYTGSIGWLGPCDTAHFNIAIRTVVLHDGTAYFHTGGGVVIDSTPENEYEETLIKAKGIFEALRKTLTDTTLFT